MKNTFVYQAEKPVIKLLSYYKLQIPIYLKMKVRNYWG